MEYPDPQLVIVARSPKPKLGASFSRNPWQLKELGAVAISRFWLHGEQAQCLGLEGVRLGQLLEGGRFALDGDLHGIARSRAQMRQQAGEAVDRLARRRLVRLLFLLDGGGGFGGLDGVALAAAFFQLFILI